MNFRKVNFFHHLLIKNSRQRYWWNSTEIVYTVDLILYHKIAYLIITLIRKGGIFFLLFDKKNGSCNICVIGGLNDYSSTCKLCCYACTVYLNVCSTNVYIFISIKTCVWIQYKIALDCWLQSIETYMCLKCKKDEIQHSSNFCRYL